MGTFAEATVLSVGVSGGQKKAIISCVGSASYATGGDILDLDVGTTAATSAMGGWAGFAVVDFVTGYAATAANSKYKCHYVRAASGAPATGLIKIDDMIQATPAEIANATDLSGQTFYFEVTGR